MAAQRTYPFYTDMADIKAMLESIARSFGYHYGVDKKVRINTVSQSPTKTTAGTGIKGFGDFFDYANAIAPLGNASSRRLRKLLHYLIQRSYKNGYNAKSVSRWRLLHNRGKQLCNGEDGYSGGE
jgi:enoyl-[acyl-carrier-protein] reductase (NADH)